MGDAIAKDQGGGSGLAGEVARMQSRKSCNSDENNRPTMERVARENESGTRERGAPWRIGRPVFTVDTVIRGRGTIGSHGAKRTRIGIKVERQGTRPRIEIGRVAQGEYGVSEGVPSAQV